MIEKLKFIYVRKDRKNRIVGFEVADKKNLEEAVSEAKKYLIENRISKGYDLKYKNAILFITQSSTFEDVWAQYEDHLRFINS